MFLSACVIGVFVGIFCIQNPELAWWLYERDNALWGRTITQPRRWGNYVYAIGTFLITLGSLGMYIAMFGHG